MKVLSTHYLGCLGRRRARARVLQIRRWQLDSLPHGDGSPLAVSTTQKALALESLQALGINAETQVQHRRRGKWDARYDVTTIGEYEDPVSGGTLTLR